MDPCVNMQFDLIIIISNGEGDLSIWNKFPCKS